MQISSNTECWFVRKPAPTLGSPGRKGRSHIYPCGRRGRLCLERVLGVCAHVWQGALSSHTSMAIGQAGPGSSSMVP